MLDKLFIHADSAVAEDKIIGIAAMFPGFMFADLDLQRASRGRISYGIPENIQEHLLEPLLVSQNIFMFHQQGMQLQMQTLFLSFWIDHGDDLIHQLREVENVGA